MITVTADEGNQDILEGPPGLKVRQAMQDGRLRDALTELGYKRVDYVSLPEEEPPLELEVTFCYMNIPGGISDSINAGGYPVAWLTEDNKVVARDGTVLYAGATRGDAVAWCLNRKPTGYEPWTK